MRISLFYVIASSRKLKCSALISILIPHGDDGLVTTTLLKGSVQIQSTVNNKSVVLKPSEQSTITAGGQLEIIKNANAEEVLAWKTDCFLSREQE